MEEFSQSDVLISKDIAKKRKTHWITRKTKNLTGICPRKVIQDVLIVEKTQKIINTCIF
jgi:hypothetical protein